MILVPMNEDVELDLTGQRSNQNQTHSQGKCVLSQLSPFNEHRFDAMMLYFSRKYGRKLSQYDMMKLHVMTDVFHVLATARPAIGGSLEPWQYGPVVRAAYNRVAKWWHDFDRTGRQPEYFRLVEHDGNAKRFVAATDVDEDDFSDSEKAAMDAAWAAVQDLLDDWRRADAFFHDSDASFIGNAWYKAKAEGRRAIDWNDIIDAFDRFHNADHSHIKTLMTIS